MKILRLPAYFLPEKFSSAHLQYDRLQIWSQIGFEIEVYTPIPTRGISIETRNAYKKSPNEELFSGK
ncbi:MAG: hypothetical protein KBS41_05730, partial [Oscillospiraceae bacterium]|nr:hypothetical protein [Candidatus Equicaccousia limihippi]